MVYVKLFEDFIFESSSNKLIEEILKAAEQKVVEMVGKIEKYYIEKNIHLNKNLSTGFLI